METTSMAAIAADRRGARTERALDESQSVWAMNQGHSALWVVWDCSGEAWSLFTIGDWGFDCLVGVLGVLGVCASFGRNGRNVEGACQLSRQE